eukprot:GEZU01004314.1.p1 GENE.GEZU01004314.1~~GEZU01004314.1.p1  ORF type:complete len:306 (-),score=56.02 GEZU01004314.1:8-883(-)
MRVNIFRNTGRKEHGKAVVVPSTFAEFLQRCSQKLGFMPEQPALRVFTEKGGEIEEIDEILDDDVLFISCGEEFVPPIAQQKPMPTHADSQQITSANINVATAPVQPTAPSGFPITVKAIAKSLSPAILVFRPDSTIGQLKDEIARHFQLSSFAVYYTLIFEGRELRNDSCQLKEYNMHQHSNCQVFLVEKPFEIRITTKSQRVIRLNVKCNDTIADIKSMLSNMEGYPVEQQQLGHRAPSDPYHDQILADDTTLEQHNILHSGSTSASPCLTTNPTQPDLIMMCHCNVSK